MVAKLAKFRSGSAPPRVPSKPIALPSLPPFISSPFGLSVNGDLYGGTTDSSKGLPRNSESSRTLYISSDAEMTTAFGSYQHGRSSNESSRSSSSQSSGSSQISTEGSRSPSTRRTKRMGMDMGRPKTTSSPLPSPATSLTSSASSTSSSQFSTRALPTPPSVLPDFDLIFPLFAPRTYQNMRVLPNSSQYAVTSYPAVVDRTEKKKSKPKIRRKAIPILLDLGSSDEEDLVEYTSPESISGRRSSMESEDRDVGDVEERSSLDRVAPVAVRVADSGQEQQAAGWGCFYDEDDVEVLIIKLPTV